MAKNALVTVPDGQWVQLTDANVSAITIIHEGGGEVRLQGSTSAAAPTSSPSVGLPLKREHYGYVNYTLADLFPHVAAVRVFAFTTHGPVNLLVMHA